jgi:hypothetical protein
MFKRAAVIPLNPETDKFVFVREVSHLRYYYFYLQFSCYCGSVLFPVTEFLKVADNISGFFSFSGRSTHFILFRPFLTENYDLANLALLCVVIVLMLL